MHNDKYVGPNRRLVTVWPPVIRVNTKNRRGVRGTVTTTPLPRRIKVTVRIVPSKKSGEE